LVVLPELKTLVSLENLEEYLLRTLASKVAVEEAVEEEGLR
jgi:hypothetical protein